MKQTKKTTLSSVKHNFFSLSFGFSHTSAFRVLSLGPKDSPCFVQYVLPYT